VAASDRHAPPIAEIDVLWITAGLGCDGDTIAMTAATQPSLEDIVNGGIPWTPKVHFHNPFLAAENGDEFLLRFHQAAKGSVDPFILVVEGSIPDETNKVEGYWASLGTDAATGQPITTCTWIDRLAPHAWAVMAVGTCATYGGIHAMEGNPTGCMGLPDYLGWEWKSKSGTPIVCVPGCPAQPDNMTETLLLLSLHLAGLAPAPELDEQLRPRWLFGRTTRESCSRAGFTEQGKFATEYGADSRCLVKLGCKGPVARCNVPTRGWVNGVGGCPNVGGICIACTMPSFPDAYMPFMEADQWGNAAANFQRFSYGPIFRYFRSRNLQKRYEREPEWRQPGSELTSGYVRRWPS